MFFFALTASKISAAASPGVVVYRYRDAPSEVGDGEVDQDRTYSWGLVLEQTPLPRHYVHAERSRVALALTTYDSASAGLCPLLIVGTQHCLRDLASTW